MQNQIELFKKREAELQESIADKRESIQREKRELLVISKARIQLEKLNEQLISGTLLSENTDLTDENE